MKLIQCLALSLLLAITCTAQHNENYSYTIPGRIPVLRQPKSMDCWITVATMLLSWKNQKTLQIDEVADSLGLPWKIYYETNAGLPYNDQSAFIQKVGLKSEPPANYLLVAYREFLEKYGPLWIIMGNGITAHARILIGIDITNEDKTTIFRFINPEKDFIEEMPAEKFFKKFEAEARIANEEKWHDLRIQIYHF